MQRVVVVYEVPDDVVDEFARVVYWDFDLQKRPAYPGAVMLVLSIQDPETLEHREPRG